MILRIHNDDNTDYVDYEADTLEEIKEAVKERIDLPGWSKGWSEGIDK